MKYLTLGKTDVKISKVIMGCWGIGGGYTWGDADEKESIDTLKTALDYGVTTFDTAEFYSKGYSEEIVGKALEGQRQKAVITTKVWVDNMAGDKISEACENSLKRMKTDYIDLYQIHWPNRDVPLEETLRAIEKLKQDGKIRAIGVCNYGVKDLSEAISISDIVSDQMAYSLLFRAIEFEILPKCKDIGMGVIAYSPMAQGLLTGVFSKPGDVDDERARIRFYSKDRPGTVHDEDGYETEVFAGIAKIREICERIDQPMANVALAWVLHQPGVISVLAGARKPKEIIEDAKAADINLSDTVLKELTATTEDLKQKMGSNADPWRTKSRIR